MTTIRRQKGPVERVRTLMSKWQLWFGKKEKVEGVAIVFMAADMGLKLMPNGLSDADRRDWCLKLCEVLNEARARGAL